MLKVQIALEADFAEAVVELEVLVLHFAGKVEVAVDPAEAAHIVQGILYVKDQQHFDLVFEVFVLS